MSHPPRHRQTFPAGWRAVTCMVRKILGDGRDSGLLEKLQNGDLALELTPKVALQLD
jgi:hypothetical protein